MQLDLLAHLDQLEQLEQRDQPVTQEPQALRVCLALLDPWDRPGRLEDKDLLVPVVLREHQDSLVELEQQESRVFRVQ